MDSTGSVSDLILGVKRGDDRATADLWARYYTKLVRLAQRKLEKVGARKRLADEEDIATEAFTRFCRAAEQGKIPQIADRNALWPLLIRITAQRAVDLRRRELAKGAGDVRGESVFESSASGSNPGIAAAIDEGPTPELAAIAIEQTRRLLTALRDDEHRNIAIARMEGFTHKEIAAQRGCSLSKIERTTQIIRKVFERECDAAPE